jgi:hypothetical protein
MHTIWTWETFNLQEKILYIYIYIYIFMSRVYKSYIYIYIFNPIRAFYIFSVEGIQKIILILCKICATCQRQNKSSSTIVGTKEFARYSCKRYWDVFQLTLTKVYVFQRWWWWWWGAEAPYWWFNHGAPSPSFHFWEERRKKMSEKRKNGWRGRREDGELAPPLGLSTYTCDK